MTEVPFAARLHWQTATIARTLPRTPRIKSIFFRLAEPFEFRAGQHVDLRLTAPDGYHAVRSYSIASAPGTSSEIELAIERLDDGEVSPYLHDVAAPGDEIELRGPLGGHFVWSPADGGPLLLIGAGSGLVPLMSMIRHALVARTDVPILLVLSARTSDEVLYRDELFALERQLPEFTLVLLLTREAPSRPGDYGRRIDAAIVAEALGRLPAAPKHVFICGSNPFVNASADGIISTGLAASLIRTERYGG